MSTYSTHLIRSTSPIGVPLMVRLVARSASELVETTNRGVEGKKAKVWEGKGVSSWRWVFIAW